MEKGVWRFEIALGLFFYIFFWWRPLEERESGDLKLLWDYLSTFLGGNPWKRESGDLRLLCDYFFLVATLGKGSLEI